MAGLETQVRNALIEQRTDELVECTKDPRYKAAMEDTVQMILDSLMPALQKEVKMDEQEAAEFRADMGKEILPQLNAMLNNPEQLRQRMYETAKKEYMPAKSFKARLDKQCRKLGLPKEPEEQYRRSHEPAINSARKKDRLVARLAKIAKQEGLDKALQRETQYALVRELYPTPQDYRASAEQAGQAALVFTQQVQAPLMADGTYGRRLGMAFGATNAIVKNLMDKHRELRDIYLERKIKDIYG